MAGGRRHRRGPRRALPGPGELRLLGALQPRGRPGCHAGAGQSVRRGPGHVRLVPGGDPERAADERRRRAAMNIIFLLAPLSLGIALISLVAFWWTVRDGQYDDPAGDAA